jgi:hypothetical protein
LQRQRPTDAGGKHAKILPISARFLPQSMKPEETTCLIPLQFTGRAMAAFRLSTYLIRLSVFFESELTYTFRETFRGSRDLE